MLNRVSMRTDALCNGGRSLIEYDGLFSQAGPFIMRGYLGAYGIRIGGMNRLQDFGYVPVQETPAHRAQFSVGDLSQFVVREVVTRIGIFPDDASLPEFVQRLDDRLFRHLAGARQHFDAEGPPGCSGQGDQGACSRRQPGEARREDGLHPGRKRSTGRRRPFIGLRLALVFRGRQPGSNAFDHKKRVALRLPVQPGG